MARSVAEFLLARIADDEAVAHRLADADWQDGWDGLSGESWRHFRRFDSDRILTECKAKRRIVNLIIQTAAPELQQVLRELGAPFLDHPDYNPGWRPSDQLQDEANAVHHTCPPRAFLECPECGEVIAVPIHVAVTTDEAGAQWISATPNEQAVWDHALAHMDA